MKWLLFICSNCLIITGSVILCLTYNINSGWFFFGVFSGILNIVLLIINIYIMLKGNKYE